MAYKHLLGVWIGKRQNQHYCFCWPKTTSLFNLAYVENTGLRWLAITYLLLYLAFTMANTSYSGAVKIYTMCLEALSGPKRKFLEPST